MKRNRNKVSGDIIAALDIGTTQITCLIARLTEDHDLRIIGSACHASQGIRAGLIVDMEAVCKAVGRTINDAENIAGERLDQIVVNVSGPNLHAFDAQANVPLAHHSVRDSDITKAIAYGKHQDHISDMDWQIFQTIPMTYSVDGHHGTRDPRGMFGHYLTAHLHSVAASPGTLRNLSSCIERNHLLVESFCISSFASGLACLVKDERELGAIVIDMGGGTTDIAVFSERSVIFTDCLGIGGNHVTQDIARGLTTPVTHAERVKTLYGTALPSKKDDQETIEIPRIGEQEPAYQIPKSLLTGIIQPRLEETFELIRSSLEENGFLQGSSRQVVLTGGASQMQGIRELAQLILDKQVRIGHPINIKGLTESINIPSFSTAIGLLNFANRHHTDHFSETAYPPVGNFAYRVGHWLRENL